MNVVALDSDELVKNVLTTTYNKGWYGTYVVPCTHHELGLKEKKKKLEPADYADKYVRMMTGPELNAALGFRGAEMVCSGDVDASKQLAHAMGNAVCPAVVEALLAQMFEAVKLPFKICEETIQERAKLKEQAKREKWPGFNKPLCHEIKTDFPKPHDIIDIRVHTFTHTDDEGGVE